MGVAKCVSIVGVNMNPEQPVSLIMSWRPEVRPFVYEILIVQHYNLYQNDDNEVTSSIIPCILILKIVKVIILSYLWFAP